MRVNRVLLMPLKVGIVSANLQRAFLLTSEQRDVRELHEPSGERRGALMRTLGEMMSEWEGMGGFDKGYISALQDCAADLAPVQEALWALRDETQAMCFYWKTTHEHGHCRKANGMDHVCAFCELTEKFDARLGPRPERKGEGQ